MFFPLACFCFLWTFVSPSFPLICSGFSVANGHPTAQSFADQPPIRVESKSSETERQDWHIIDPKKYRIICSTRTYQVIDFGATQLTTLIFLPLVPLSHSGSQSAAAAEKRRNQRNKRIDPNGQTRQQQQTRKHVTTNRKSL